MTEHPLTKRGSILVTPERIAYSGLIGSPSRRQFAATVIYLAIDAPFEISVEGDTPRRAWLATIPPNRPHQIRSADRLIRKLLMEPESLLSAGSLPSMTVNARSTEYLDLTAAFDAWLQGALPLDESAASFDCLFFGRPLEPLQVDARIDHIVRKIRAAPFVQVSAAECARLSYLSTSRFVHLFKEELGTTLRGYCAWKRARAVIPWMTTPRKLTELALDAGYADATHFSHSMRHIFGLCPRDILSGSQRLTLQYPAKGLTAMPLSLTSS